jgi:hypothetical protein
MVLGRISAKFSFQGYVNEHTNLMTKSNRFAGQFAIKSLTSLQVIKQLFVPCQVAFLSSLIVNFQYMVWCQHKPKTNLTV